MQPRRGLHWLVLARIGLQSGMPRSEGLILIGMGNDAVHLVCWLLRFTAWRAWIVSRDAANRYELRLQINLRICRIDYGVFTIEPRKEFGIAMILGNILLFMSFEPYSVRDLLLKQE